MDRFSNQLGVADQLPPFGESHGYPGRQLATKDLILHLEVLDLPGLIPVRTDGKDVKQMVKQAHHGEIRIFSMNSAEVQHFGTPN